jgi:hypothetical protein
LLRATLTSLTHTPRCIQQSFGTVGRFRMQSSMPGLRPDRMISFFLFMSQSDFGDDLVTFTGGRGCRSNPLCHSLSCCFHLLLPFGHSPMPRPSVDWTIRWPALFWLLCWTGDQCSRIHSMHIPLSRAVCLLHSPSHFPFPTLSHLYPLILSLTYACRDWRWLWPSADRICGPH